MPTNAQLQLCLRLRHSIDPKKIAHGYTAPFFGLMPLNNTIPTGDGGAMLNSGDFVPVAQGISVPCSRGGPPLLDE
jgi:hypothetical protein